MKAWLRRWLGIDDIAHRLTNNETACTRVGARQAADEHKVDMLMSLVKVGVDYSPIGNSWAVVCIAGKPTYVDFYNLRSQDARDMLELLKGYGIKRDNIRFDGPMGIEKWLG